MKTDDSGDGDDAGWLVLARHGQTGLNASGVLRGHLDPPLDDVGESEAAALGDALVSWLAGRPVVALRSSPLRRAVQTAEAIAAALPAPPPVESEPGLIDRDYGRWAGHRLGEVEAECGSVDQADGVEGAGAVRDRARAVLDAQIPLLATGPVVLVAHDVVNRLLLTSLDPSLGPADNLPQRTACWNLLRHLDGVWSVQLIDQ